MRGRVDVRSMFSIKVDRKSNLSDKNHIIWFDIFLSLSLSTYLCDIIRVIESEGTVQSNRISKHKLARGVI